MKFIHVTDIHVMGRTPKYRKDDFLQTILDKIVWVQNYAASVNATAILCTGDMFDRADTAYSVLNDLLPVLQSSEVPWLSIIGNHDEYGYNPNTIDRTPMGTLFKSGAMQYVNYACPKFEEDENQIVCITGVDSTVETDNREDKEYDYGVVDGCDFYPDDARPVTTIHLSHGFLADKNWGDKIHHTQIGEIYDKVEADIILCGHEHSGFGVKTAPNGKLFINPGALGRTTSGVGDMNRNVNIAEITIDGEYKSAKLVRVEISKPSEDVIDADKAQEDKERANMLNEFSQTIRNVDTTSVSMNPFEAIDAIYNEVFESMGVPKEMFDDITNEAKKALQRAHERVGGDL